MKALHKSNKYRVTKQRKVVLDVIQSTCEHPTAADIFVSAQQKDATLGLATIYRSLDFLEKNGYIIRLKSKNGEARYDGKLEQHCHLICTHCGDIQDIDDVKKIAIDSTDLLQSGFVPNFDYLEIFGICKKCNKLSNNN